MTTGLVVHDHQMLGVIKVPPDLCKGHLRQTCPLKECHSLLTTDAPILVKVCSSEEGIEDLRIRHGSSPLATRHQKP